MNVLIMVNYIDRVFVYIGALEVTPSISRLRKRKDYLECYE